MLTKKSLAVGIIFIFVSVVLSLNLVSAHWYCPNTGLYIPYNTAPVSSYSISYNNATNNITLEIEARICRQGFLSKGIFTTHWGFGSNASVCNFRFPTGECGVGGYESRRCVYHLGWKDLLLPSGYDLRPGTSGVRVSEVNDFRCMGGKMLVVNRTIVLKLDNYNTLASGGFSMAVQYPNENNIKSYPSEFISLSQFNPPIACHNDSECIINGCSESSNYCALGDVYHDYTSFTCHNPGASNSYCTSQTVPTLIGHCSFVCSSGNCIGS